jgi:hypothetical protein
MNTDLFKFLKNNFNDPKILFVVYSVCKITSMMQFLEHNLLFLLFTEKLGIYFLWFMPHSTMLNKLNYISLRLIALFCNQLNICYL